MLRFIVFFDKIFHACSFVSTWVQNHNEMDNEVPWTFKNSLSPDQHAVSSLLSELSNHYIGSAQVSDMTNSMCFVEIVLPVFPFDVSVYTPFGFHHEFEMAWCVIPSSISNISDSQFPNPFLKGWYLCNGQWNRF